MLQTKILSQLNLQKICCPQSLLKHGRIALHTDDIYFFLSYTFVLDNKKLINIK